jgi:NAD(P)-dependent dehydrogenase (short-subunit alcohol dehydrogenase family)
MTQIDLTGRTALVTGAARGIGAATAARLAEAGATVVIADVLEDQGAAVAAGLRARGLSARFVHLDVTADLSWEAALFETVDATDRLDLLVNNAGVEVTSLIVDADPAAFRRLFEVNVLGACLGMKHALHAMRPGGQAGRGGAIVNVSSMAARMALPASGLYAASKAALERLTKVAAVEAGRLGHGVRVNCVCPGFVQTELSARSAQKAVDMGMFPDRAAFDAHVLGLTPLGRLGAPDNVADAVAFLGSDAASFITGAALEVAGGLGAA